MSRFSALLQNLFNVNNAVYVVWATRLSYLRTRQSNLLQKIIRTHFAVGSYYLLLAEAEGFEPPWACTQTVFKTASL